MFEAHAYFVFLATAAVLVVSPGPDTLLILSRTLASGTTSGLMTLVGSQVGNVLQAVLAGVGISTVVLLFPAAFVALKFTGALYLVYLAVQAWRAPGTLEPQQRLSNTPPQPARYFIQGMTSNLTNPKMIAFFIALFPQFINPDSHSAGLQSLILGTTLAVMAVIWIGLLVLITGRYRSSVATNKTFLLVANRLASVTFLGLACRVALEQRR